MRVYVVYTIRKVRLKCFYSEYEFSGYVTRKSGREIESQRYHPSMYVCDKGKGRPIFASPQSIIELSMVFTMAQNSSQSNNGQFLENEYLFVVLNILYI